MRKLGFRRVWLATLCGAVVALGASVAPAQGADASDPLFLYVPVLHPFVKTLPPGPPPTSYFNGPCGLAVDSTGKFYLSDYYHNTIDIYSTFKSVEPEGIVWRPSYITQLKEEEPLDAAKHFVDGPCGLALDATNALYVNNYHRNVVKYSPYPSFGVGAMIDSSEPTGVAVDPTSGNVYVDDRTYIAEYEAPVEPEDEPVAKIGLDSLGDYYGVAVSGYSGTLGRVYVPDATTGTVRVYNPAVDKTNPVATITGPPGGFNDLHDSAVAVDRVTGEVYVADNLQPLYAEQPQAAIHVFSPGGLYEGHLKHNVSDARPPGLAVDNSATGTQGRVYVTSGNTTEAGVYAYPPGAATQGFSLPGWPVGGCSGIPTCVETTGGSSAAGGEFGAVSAAAPPSSSAIAEVSTVGVTANAAARQPHRAHRRHRASHRRQGRVGHHRAKRRDR